MSEKLAEISKQDGQSINIFPNHNSEPAYHIALNKENCFEWKVLNTAKQWKLRKFKEAVSISILKTKFEQTNQIF